MPRSRAPTSGGGQLPLSMFLPESSWRPPDLNTLPSWAGARRVGLDTETYDPQLKQLGPGVRRGGQIVGISFCIEDDRPYYLPIRHAGGDNLDPGKVLQYLQDQAKVFSGSVVGANLPYDLDYLAEERVVFRRAEWFRDVQIADPCINELQNGYSLQEIAERYEMPGKNQALLEEAARAYNLDPKKDMWQLPARYVGPYGEEDARLPLQILRRQERVIDDEDLWQVYNLESKVLPVLVKMRRRGVRIDFDKLAQVERWALGEETKALAEVKHLTGCSVPVGDVWKPEVMAAPLRQIGVVFKTKKPSVTKELLAELDHPVAKLLARARKVNKLRTTFAASVRRHATNGRVHCTFNQMRRAKDGQDSEEGGEEGGARYGRLSCTDPNLQQQPSRDEFAKLWRSIYVPEEGELWASNDYSQQEPRWLTHFAELCNLRGAFEAAERYRNDPDTDNHNMMTEIIYGSEVVHAWAKEEYKKRRFQCKQIFLGLCYGMGGAKLARSLGLPTKWIQLRSGKTIEVAGDEAEAVLAQFMAGAPYVKSLAELCENRAKEKGFIVTALGRRCRFPKSESGQFDWCHKALNRLIQGSSADQTKKALVDADAAGIRLQLQVHDELGQSVADEGVARQLAEIMVNCVPCRVPAKVDIEIGPSWGGSM